MKHLMLDLETMSTQPNAAIVQIGACEFTLGEEKVGAGMRCTVSLRSCADVGLHIDADTVIWWLSQERAAQDTLLRQRVDLPQGLNDLKEFLRLTGAQYVWANSPAFDCVIARSAYRAVGWPCPWNFRVERDVRTYRALAGAVIGARAEQVLELVEPAAVVHDALEDAKFQARQLQALTREIRRAT